MDIGYYCSLLGVQPPFTAPAVKKAYRKLVRENHPDIFPAEEKAAQEFKMMEINEAYYNLLALCKKECAQALAPAPRPQVVSADTIEKDGFVYRGVDLTPSDSKTVGEHRDPAYAYYKQGFINYSKGSGGMVARFKKIKGRTINDALKRVEESLHCFRLAQEYFTRVVNDYPDCIWAQDAHFKLKRIERFTDLYRKIKFNTEALIERRNRFMHNR